MTITIKPNSIVTDEVAIKLVDEIYQSKVKFDLKDGMESQTYTTRDIEDITKVIAIEISKTKNGTLTFNFKEQ